MVPMQSTGCSASLQLGTPLSCQARLSNLLTNKNVLAFHSGRCEMGDDWLGSPFAKKDAFYFALPLPGLTFTEQKVSPHHEGKSHY